MRFPKGPRPKNDRKGASSTGFSRWPFNTPITPLHGAALAYLWVGESPGPTHRPKGKPAKFAGGKPKYSLMMKMAKWAFQLFCSFGRSELKAVFYGANGFSGPTWKKIKTAKSPEPYCSTKAAFAFTLSPKATRQRLPVETSQKATVTA